MIGVILECVAGLRMGEDGQAAPVEHQPGHDVGELILADGELTASARMWADWIVVHTPDLHAEFLPGGLDDFCDKVIPELQRRGLFRLEYEGKTLRENLGLPRPENRFFDSGKAVAAE